MIKKRAFLLVLLIFFLTIGTAILASPGGPTGGFAINWWTVDSGGGTSSGGPYAMSGTVGQADAGRHSGGSYVLTGGFWNSSVNGIIPGHYTRHIPVMLKN